MGIEDVLGFQYLQPPSRASLKRSLEQLLLLGALDRRTVALARECDVGSADQTGPRNGAASAGSSLLPSADSEQRVSLLDRGEESRGVSDSRFWISCRFSLWRTCFTRLARNERRPTCRTDGSPLCTEIISLI